MTNVVLGDVVSSTPIDACPRESLGMLCVADNGFECICKDVEISVLEVVQDTKGPVAVLSLTLREGIQDWQGIKKGITLTGYKPDWKVTQGGMDYGITLTLSFELWRPQNSALREYLATGI